MTLSTVTTAAGPSTSHKAVAGTVPLSAQPFGLQATRSASGAPEGGGEMPMNQAEQKAKDEKMNKELEKLVDSQKLEGSAYKFVARCKLCGWQTLEHEESDGKKLVVKHGAVHWPAIQAQQTSSAT